MKPRLYYTADTRSVELNPPTTMQHCTGRGLREGDVTVAKLMENCMAPTKNYLVRFLEMGNVHKNRTILNNKTIVPIPESMVR